MQTTRDRDRDEVIVFGGTEVKQTPLAWLLSLYGERSALAHLIGIRLAIVVTSGLAFLAPLRVQAAGTPTEQAGLVHELVFRSIYDVAPAASIQLANGVAVHTVDWKALTVAQLGTQTDSAGHTRPITCSATLVGPGVMLTAAHCFDGGPGQGLRTTAALRIGGYDLKLTCSVAPAYAQAVDGQLWNGFVPRVSQDYALCRYSAPTALPAEWADLHYPVLDAASPLHIGDPVLMTGFGCSHVSVDPISGFIFSQDDAQLRIGDSLISDVPSGTGPNADFLETSSAGAPAPVLCRGDSGGPLITGASVAKQNALRRIRGVNSLITAELSGTGSYRLLSRIAALGTNDFQTFVHHWIAQNNAITVCGINRPAGHSPCAN